MYGYFVHIRQCPYIHPLLHFCHIQNHIHTQKNHRYHDRSYVVLISMNLDNLLVLHIENKELSKLLWQLVGNYRYLSYNKIRLHKIRGKVPTYFRRSASRFLFLISMSRVNTRQYFDIYHRPIHNHLYMYIRMNLDYSNIRILLLYFHMPI